MKKINSRYEYIDVLRGLAALSIVAIHTAAWAGMSYVPRWFLSLTLSFDVPFFFFLSGWGASLHRGDIIKTSKRLGIIWLQWIGFITFAGAICFFISLSDHNSLGLRGFQSIKELFDSFAFHPMLPYSGNIAGALWFMPHYFVVVFTNTAITILFSRRENPERLIKWYCVMLAFIFVWITTGKTFFGVDSYVIFYGFFWMLGFNRKNIRVDTMLRLVTCLLLAFVGYYVSSRWLEIPLWDVQRAKFPPTVQYAFWSLPVIFVALFVEKMFTPPPSLTRKFLAHIGENAIFYFFAQGVSCTMNYYFVKMILIENWFVKWNVTFIRCVLLTIMMAEVLSFLWKMVVLKFFEILRLGK